MSTQQQVSTTPMKGSRNSAKRQQRKNNTPASQGKSIMLTTPPSSPSRVASPGDVYAEGTPAYNSDYNGSRKKNGIRSGKKNRENTRPNNPTYSNGVGHRHTSSQPSIASPLPLKESPHYAGPTFHASPAPSALPMPSFFSKSVPDSGLSTALELENELEEESTPELTPSKPKSSAPRVNNHEPSPLDFLFKAAIDARNKTQSPEAAPKAAVPSSDSKIGHRSNPSGNNIFSLELDGFDRTMSSYSTTVSSYKDKMNALMSDGNQHNAKPEMDDAQRRLKTEELKHLLLNPRPQRPASASPHLKGPIRGYANATGIPYSINQPQHASSGPPTPMSFNGNMQQNVIPGPGQKQLQEPYRSPRGVGPENTNPAAFHQQFSPYASPANTARMNNNNNYGAYSQSPFRGVPSAQRYQSPSPFNTKIQATPPSRTPELDSKKMEDDLRRILKLDMANGIQTNGVQSSMA